MPRRCSARRKWPRGSPGAAAPHAANVAPVRSTGWTAPTPPANRRNSRYPATSTNAEAETAAGATARATSRTMRTKRNASPRPRSRPAAGPRPGRPHRRAPRNRHLPLRPASIRARCATRAPANCSRCHARSPCSRVPASPRTCTRGRRAGCACSSPASRCPRPISRCCACSRRRSGGGAAAGSGARLQRAGRPAAAPVRPPAHTATVRGRARHVARAAAHAVARRRPMLRSTREVFASGAGSAFLASTFTARRTMRARRARHRRFGIRT